MPRAPRIDVGGQIYHVINRANGRRTIFETDADYRHFESLLRDALEEKDMRLLAYILMPNHWRIMVSGTFSSVNLIFVSKCPPDPSRRAGTVPVYIR